MFNLIHNGNSNLVGWAWENFCFRAGGRTADGLDVLEKADNRRPSMDAQKISR